VQDVIGKQFQANRGAIPATPVIDEYARVGNKRSMLEEITVEEVKTVLSKTNHKATDSSNLTEKCMYMMAFKYGGCIALQERLVQVLNRMMKLPLESIAPADLTQQHPEVRELNQVLITPIAKTMELKKFRPISIQGPVRKVLSRIWLKRINVEAIVSKRQYAFTKLRTRDALVRIIKMLSTNTILQRLLISQERTTQWTPVYFTPSCVDGSLKILLVWWRCGVCLISSG
jgi:hypothetical protein